MLLNKKSENLTNITYESEYFNQAHFIKDFKGLTYINPKEFLGNENRALSSLFYKESECRIFTIFVFASNLNLSCQIKTDKMRKSICCTSINSFIKYYSVQQQ